MLILVFALAMLGLIFAVAMVGAAVYQAGEPLWAPLLFAFGTILMVIAIVLALRGPGRKKNW
jgi:hypothetical protein